MQLFEGNFKLVESPETECALYSTDCCSPLQNFLVLSTLHMVKATGQALGGMKSSHTKWPC